MTSSSSTTPPLTIAVAGGSGTVGRHVVDVAVRRGHRAISLSRADGVDLMTGTGLEVSLGGVDTVIDVSSRQTQKSKESREFFGGVTANLLAAEKSLGIAHHVALSVVGIERAPDGYYAGKMLQEEIVSGSEVPWSILRATQFHEFAAQLFGAVRIGPFAIVPTMVSEPVAAREVAHRLIELAETGPSGRVRDLGGPHRESVPDMVRAWAAATGKKGHVVSVPLPGRLGRAMRNGSLLSAPDSDRGVQTFTEWLAQAPAEPSSTDR